MPSICPPHGFGTDRHLAPSDVIWTSPRPGINSTPPQPALVDDRRLRAVLDLQFDVLYDWNIKTGAIYFAEQLDAMLGLPPGGFPRNLQGWLENVHPAEHDEVRDGLWTSVTTGRPFRSQYRLRRADGRYVTVSDRGVTLSDAAGEPANMIGAMRDVAGEREAQQVLREACELRDVLFRIGKPAMQVDAAGDYVDATPTALAFFQRSADEMLGGNVRDDFPPEVVALLGEQDLDERGVELEVECAVNSEVKNLMLTVLPCHIGAECGYFLLGTDISPQKALQHELTRSESELRRQATILDERNTVLRVLLDQREQDRAELEQGIVGNVELLIEPSLDRLGKALAHRPERLEVEAIRANLREIVSPFAQRLASQVGSGQPLTSRQTQVANLVRLGKTSAEIAEALHITASAVAYHRANIRRKLGLPKRGPHLAAHLGTIGRE